MKRILLLAVLTAILFAGLTGCSALKENNFIDDLPKLDYEVEIGKGNHMTISPSLYYIDLSSGELTIESRSLIVPESIAMEEVMIKTILAGPVQKNLYVPCEGFTLDRIEKTGSLLNVYISGNELTDEQKFLSACCISNSIVNYCDISYVSVYFNGKIIGIDQNPISVLSSTDVNISALYKDYQNKFSVSDTIDQNNKSISLDTTLYFLSENKEFIIPEVRSVKYESGNYLTQLLKELSQGPKYNRSISQCIKREDNWLNGFENEYIEESSTVHLKFLTSPFFSDKFPTKLEYASLFYSVMSLYPKADTLLLEIENGGIIQIKRNLINNLVGQDITVHLPSSDFKNLKTDTVTISSSNAHRITVRLSELIKMESRNSTVHISNDYFIGSKIDGKICIVNFKHEFYDTLQNYSERTVSVILQSIVTTAAEDTRIKYVLFLSGGERIENFGDDLYLYYPLMPNIGIIV